MAIVIGIKGDVSTGKSTSIGTLDPKTTLIINYLKSKDLPFKGARKMYPKNVTVKDGGNFVSPKAEAIPLILKDDATMSRFKVVIVDDLCYTMTSEYMDKANQKGFDKYVTLAANFYNILKAAQECKAEYVVLMLHVERVYDGADVIDSKIKTVGKMIDNTFNAEGLFTILLQTDVKFSEDGVPLYQFCTNKEFGISAKSPMGMFPQRISNDLKLVIEDSEKYYNEEI